MAIPQYYAITDFSLGQNNEFDPRSLRPLANEDSGMEATKIENYDIIEKGAIATATGFIEYFSTGTGEPSIYVENYEADLRYLIAVSDEKPFYGRKWSNLTIHDCDAYTGGSYGNFAISGDGSSLANTTTRVRGTGAISFSVASGGGLTGQTKLTVSSLTSVDLSTYTGVEFYLNFSNVKKVDTTYGITNVKIRLGSSSSNYREYTSTINANGNSFIVYWNGIQKTIASPTTTVGSPNMAAVTFLEVEFNYDTNYNGGTIVIDDIRATVDGTVAPVQMTGSFWESTPENYQIINGTDFKGTNGLVHHIIANKSQQTIKVTEVGPNMLVAVDDVANSDRSYIICQMLGFLFTATGKSVEYSDPEDESTLGGTIGFNAEVTGLSPTVNKSILVGLANGEIEEITFSFDADNLIYTPVKGEYKNGDTILSHKSIKQRYNDSIFLGKEGVAYFGEAEEVASGNYRVTSLSWKVDKLIRQMNDEKAQLSAGYVKRNSKEYGISLPIGIQANINSAIFAYKWQYNAWIYRSGITLAHATEHRLESNYELFFVDGQTDSVYKFNNDYDYNGESYLRRYRTKIFNMGLPLHFKRTEFIDIGGAMPKGCKFYVAIYSDNEYEVFEVNDTSILINPKTNGYYGDDFYGNEFFGGAATGDQPYEFFRFYHKIPLPDSIIEGREFQVDIFYEGTGRPHKIDLFGMKYTIGPEGKVPDRHINNQIVTTQIELPS